jgi:hypothetical protein
MLRLLNELHSALDSWQFVAVSSSCGPTHVV